MRTPAETLAEIAELTGAEFPSSGPYTDCSALMIAWNEAHRIDQPLSVLKGWFTHLVIGVQESTDRTLEIARFWAERPTDQVIEEPHRGYGDASMQRLLDAARTKWVFVLAADELPSTELLESLWCATAYAELHDIDGVWIPFVSVTEGITAKDTEAGHLRLFRNSLQWPTSMHSRPIPSREMWWPHGHIRHERSLDEMMLDYLRIYELGKGNPGWEAHNKLMMHDACAVIAEHRGWDFVTQHAWWPQVKEIAFP